MGIPTLFKTLISDYTTLIKKTSDIKPHNLFFDLNCLIHPCCAKVDDGDEDKMISSIIDHIHKLIQLTQAKFVYIAIDGPAPKAKMIQQRLRRHKSVLEPKQWDTNAITPGTNFMNQLNIELKKTFTQSNILISDSTIPGEGEHKILQYIKQKKDIFHKQTNCIYGLDADLIMLSLVSGIPNIYLLRERTSFNIEQINDEYLYLDINTLKKEIIMEFPGIPKQRAINDYIFMCFLLGNDFIKHSPSLIIRYDGLFHLIEIYKQCQIETNHKFYLINTHTKSLIHWSNLKLWIKKLSETEDKRITNIFSIRLKQHNKYFRIYKHIQHNTDKVNTSTSISSFPSEDIMRHKPIIFMDDEKKIFYSDNWKKSYNTFTLTNSHELCSVDVLSKHVKQLCFHYLESLVWTAHYYFNTCISQEWYYPCEFSPTLFDLHNYLQTEKKISLKRYDKIYSPLQQLQFVLPKESYHVCDQLDDTNKKTLTITKEYTLLKRYDWECEPIFDSH